MVSLAAFAQRIDLTAFSRKSDQTVASNIPSSGITPINEPRISQKKRYRTAHTNKPHVTQRTENSGNTLKQFREIELRTVVVCGSIP